MITRLRASSDEKGDQENDKGDEKEAAKATQHDDGNEAGAVFEVGLLNGYANSISSS